MDRMSDTLEEFDNRVSILQVMVAVAKSDGVFKACEERRIANLVDFLKLDERDAVRVAHLIESEEPTALPEFDSLPTYDSRRYIFQQALLVAFEDGFIHRKEIEEIELLGELLQIDKADQERAWKRTRDMIDR